MARPLQVYETDDIVVTFVPAVCQHTGVCLRGLPLVFDVRRPSGALQYRLKTPGGETSPGWVEPPETRLTTRRAKGVPDVG